VGSRGNVFLVDDDESLRRATMRLLRAHCYDVVEFGSAAAFLDALQPGATGCALLDLRMPGMSGLELQSALLARRVSLPIVFLTGHADVPTSVHAMKQGALDLLEKPVSEKELVAALDRALERDRSMRESRRELAEIERRYATLTDRERQVFELLVSGQLNKQAALELGIALRTVKHHRAHVLSKMGAETPAELGRLAGMLKPRADS
jgi:FixJ family two-component response regulator